MEPIDVSATILAKSDQLNADDLIGGRELTVQITGVSKATGDQPVVAAISGGHQPWKPCKTMRRVLVAAWGGDAAQWFGRWLLLYRDDSVKWSGEAVGGIRIRAMSHIPKRVMLSLAATKGKKVTHAIDILKPPATGAQSLHDHVEAYHACTTAEVFAALEADRTKVWAALSKDDKARLKIASDAAKARIARASDVAPITPDEAAAILAREAAEADPDKGVGD